VRRVFVDTSGWFELLIPGSRLQATITAVFREPECRLVTSTHVLHELVPLILRTGTHHAAVRAGSFIRSSPEVRIECPDAAEEASIWRLFVDRPDKKYSLTDCSSFVIMRRLGITEAITTDRHFRQEGFTVLP
jgi:uncharacterized protein